MRVGDGVFGEAEQGEGMRTYVVRRWGFGEAVKTRQGKEVGEEEGEREAGVPDA